MEVMWYTRLLAIFQCFILAASYVLSLYTKNLNYNRNDPATLKKRIIAVTIMSIVSPMLTYYFVGSSEPFIQCSLWETLGIRLPGFFMASTVPLLLTMILFAGPIAIQNQNGHWDLYKEPSYWFENLTNLFWLRDHIIAPFSEELTFRACILPILILTFRPQTAVIISPLFFGLAHLHHILGRLRFGTNLQKAIIVSIFQVSYTTIFGAYSAYLFLRTGHFISPFLVHSFCNLMGFPDFSEVSSLREPQRTIIIVTCVVGLLAWSALLGPLTNPSWYQNNLYWKSYV